MPATLAEPTRRLLDAEGVAQQLDCSKRQVFRLADAGEIPVGFTIGSRMRRWCERELDGFLDRRAAIARR